MTVQENGTRNSSALSKSSDRVISFGREPMIQPKNVLDAVNKENRRKTLGRRTPSSWYDFSIHGMCLNYYAVSFVPYRLCSGEVQVKPYPHVPTHTFIKNFSALSSSSVYVLSKLFPLPLLLYEYSSPILQSTHARASTPGNIGSSGGHSGASTPPQAGTSIRNTGASTALAGSIFISVSLSRHILIEP